MNDRLRDRLQQTESGNRPDRVETLKPDLSRDGQRDLDWNRIDNLRNRADNNAHETLRERIQDARNATDRDRTPLNDLPRAARSLSSNRIERNGLLESLRDNNSNSQLRDRLSQLGQERDPRRAQDLFENLRQSPEFRDQARSARLDLDRVSGNFQ